MGLSGGHPEELSRQCRETKVERASELEGRGGSGPSLPSVGCLSLANEALCSSQSTHGVDLRTLGPLAATVTLLSPWVLAWAHGCDI